MKLDMYLSSPCEKSSLPFWKTNKIAIPENMMIVQDVDFLVEKYDGYEDEPFFKLIHRMEFIDKPHLNEGYEIIPLEVQDYARHIQECYEGGGASSEELSSYKTHATYEPNLWIAVNDSRSNAIVATGIAELDNDAGEGILEWIQVSPKYRRLGFGAFIVKELLWRMKNRADFVTVSGKVNNASNPAALYESCGFTDKIIWHIMSKR